VLVYRLIYYLLPLGIAVLLAAVHELQLQHRHIARGLELTQDALEGVVPQVMAVAVFVSGAVLLFSGASPGSSDRIEILGDLLPLPLLEASHLTGSLVGLGLTVLAGGLYRRVNAAYHLALGLLIVGIFASLLKGLDWEEALLAGLAAAALWAGRGAFYRKSALLEQRLTPGWIAAVALAMGGSVWLGLFAFKRIEYVHDLWWQFAFDADAPRFLRATLVVVTAATLLALVRLLRPAPPPPGLPNAEELRRAEMLVTGSAAADAALVLLGDKRILFDERDSGFLMFQIRGRSWIVMGNPVGPSEVAETLAWRFRDLCDRYGGRPVFYQVSQEYLPLYLDLGLTPIKIGEEGIVDLTNFSLEGSARAKLRQARTKVVKTGVQFDVVDTHALDDTLMDGLKTVSDAWLEAKQIREKGFSVGRFDPCYLRHFPIALARKDGELLAFANLWTGAGKAELSVDLMRHLPQAPNGVMDFVFVELMLWGAALGYRRFNLGMAPLSGLETHALAPLWHRIGTLTFRHGEQFYNFQGLRAYKEKFQPQWNPKYLAVPRGATLPTVLLDLSALIAGGMRGIVTR
jgi:phosphatidylglycerol lysyltransferase